MLNFTEGLERALWESNLPIITEYEFHVLGQRLFDRREISGTSLKRLPLEWDGARSRKALGRLHKRQIIVPDADFRSGVWRIVQSTSSGTAEEIVCLVDPFCYVSHLSAMQRYGLTDRSPDALHVTRPKREIWNRLRDQKIVQDLGPDAEAPLLVRYGFEESVRRRRVVEHESRNPAEMLPVSDGSRVSSLGRTFADMLSEPELCGGMRHVMDVWENHAEDSLDELVEAINGFDKKIVKVRAGYLLTEFLGIENEIIASWEENAQRGGSQKLDPDAPYAPVFSERWMISLNV